MNGALVMIGGDLGLWKAMDEAGPLTPAELAKRTGVAERYVREWLAAQAASGYIEYDTDAETLHASARASDGVRKGGQPGLSARRLPRDQLGLQGPPKITERFRSGDGFGWHEHDPELFLGTEQFFRPGYRAHLVDEWIPALEGVQEKLAGGATVADMGCGHGVSTDPDGAGLPEFDGSGDSTTTTHRSTAPVRLAEAEGASKNTEFEVASAKDFPGEGYDLVCFFDCLHDMGDPVGAMAHVREVIDDDGTVMLVEPFANDTLAENLNPVGRIFYAASTLICTPSSLDQEVGLGLGAQAGEERLRKVSEKAGFTRFRRATETPFNLVLEARP